MKAFHGALLAALVLLGLGVACAGGEGQSAGIQLPTETPTVVPTVTAVATVVATSTPTQEASMPQVNPGKIVVATLPEAKVTLKFWTWQWVLHPSPPPEMPNLRGLEKVEVPGSVQTQTTDAAGTSVFDVASMPSASEVDIAVETGSSKVHFLAALDPSYGAVFSVPLVEGELTVDLGKTDFAPGKTAGEYHGPGTRLADMEASLTVLPE